MTGAVAVTVAVWPYRLGDNKLADYFEANVAEHTFISLSILQCGRYVAQVQLGAEYIGCSTSPA